ncbi:MAG: type III-A CRISPR-associated protein Csm2 [Thermofilum sp.]
MHAQSYPKEQPFVPIPDQSVINRIIAEGDPETLVKWAEDIGRAIARQVTTSQIRNVFGTARQIQLRWPNDPAGAYRDAVLLRPKLSYFAKREGRGMEDLRRVLAPALEMISERGITEKERQDRFDRFMDFFEAIVAFHKAYGGN